MDAASDGVNGTCWKLMCALATVIVALAGVIVKLARSAWDERAARLQDHRDFEAQMNVVHNSVLKRKGESP